MNREINDFFNRVRHYMSVEDMNFDYIDQEYLSVMFPALQAPHAAGPDRHGLA